MVTSVALGIVRRSHSGGDKCSVRYSSPLPPLPGMSVPATIFSETTQVGVKAV